MKNGYFERIRSLYLRHYLCIQFLLTYQKMMNRSFFRFVYFCIIYFVNSKLVLFLFTDFFLGVLFILKAGWNGASCRLSSPRCSFRARERLQARSETTKHAYFYQVQLLEGKTLALVYFFFQSAGVLVRPLFLSEKK